MSTEGHIQNRQVLIEKQKLTEKYKYTLAQMRICAKYFYRMHILAQILLLSANIKG
jgi:hypothetical protein